MSLYVDNSPGADNPTMDLYTISWNDGNLGQGDTKTFTGSLGSTKTINAVTVTYGPAVTTGQDTADRLYELVNTDKTNGDNWADPIIITALFGGIDPYRGVSIVGNGATYVDTGVTPNTIHVVYDTSQDGGQGLNVYGYVPPDTTTDVAIQTPNAVILYHELSHAFHYALDAFPYPQTECPDAPTTGPDADEPAAEIDENVLRTQLGLCQRDVCNHDLAPPGMAASCGGSATPGGPPLGPGGGMSGGGTSGGGTSGGGGSSSGCFIVTAATGTVDAEEIARLRVLRDRVGAVSTLAGRLIQAIYDEYYQFAPVIARGIEHDPLSRLAVRQMVIAPLFAWYRLADDLAFGRSAGLERRAMIEAVLAACPAERAPAVLSLIDMGSRGGGLPALSPQLDEFGPALSKAAGLPLARWALLDPLLKAWTAGAGRHDPDDPDHLVDQVAQWLAAAPLETLRPPGDGARLEGELRQVAGFFDFAPRARLVMGERLAAAWPSAAAALRRHDFIQADGNGGA